MTARELEDALVALAKGGRLVVARNVRVPLGPPGPPGDALAGLGVKVEVSDLLPPGTFAVVAPPPTIGEKPLTLDPEAP